MERDKIVSFIRMIQDHPALWKREHKDFLNRDVRRKKFDTLSKETGWTDEECKKRLKALKDKMRMVFNALLKTKSGLPAFDTHENFVHWPFYKAMLFMKEQFIVREMDGSFHSSNVSPVSTSLISDDERSECSVASLQEPVAVDITERETPTKKANPKHPPPNIELLRNFLSLEEGKIANIRKMFEKTSEDYEWTRLTGSLCCDSRKINDPYLIMRAKTEMTRVVNDIVMQQLSMVSAQQASTSFTTEPYSTDVGYSYQCQDTCRPIP